MGGYAETELFHILEFTGKEMEHEFLLMSNVYCCILM